MHDSPICKQCNQPILGSYLMALGAAWHPEHFLCASCARPIVGASFHTHEGAPYHIACYEREIAPHCVYCGRALIGDFLVDQWGQQFCSEHQGQYPRCAFCGRLVPDGRPVPGIEQVRCPVCSVSAVEEKEAAKPIYSEVIRWVGSQGLRYNSLPLSLEICGAETLARHFQSHTQSHSLGATMTTTYSRQDGQLLRIEVKGIAVLLGLPEMLFRGVTVHELGHVWLVVQGIRDLPSWAEEGFCELLSYRYYREQNTPESAYHAQSIERNPDPIYGDGFRRMRLLADKYGFSRLLTELQTKKKLPKL
jgi:Protein DA1/LIM domain